MTHNDSHAGQPGPNNWQNFPVVATAYAGDVIHRVGTFHSTPNTTFTLDFYANTRPGHLFNGQYYGEGQHWLGSATSTTDRLRRRHLHGAPGLAASAAGEWISATATGPFGHLGVLARRPGRPLPPSSLSGIVFADFNDDGQVDFGEQGIAGVTITLTGTDDLGHAVNLSQTTDADGAYVFLEPAARHATRSPRPSRPATRRGSTASAPAAGPSRGDQFDRRPRGGPRRPELQLRRAAGRHRRRSSSGQTAGIGFWNNKNGQALIKALNGGASAPSSATGWRPPSRTCSARRRAATTWPARATPTSRRSSRAGSSLKGEKLDAQVLATALAVYVTDATLDSTGVGTQYGFIVGGNGVGDGDVQRRRQRRRLRRGEQHRR